MPIVTSRRRLVSQVLSTLETRITVPPRQSCDLKFDFVPRRVNPAYRKQVTLSLPLLNHYH